MVVTDHLLSGMILQVLRVNDGFITLQCPYFLGEAVGIGGGGAFKFRHDMCKAFYDFQQKLTMPRQNIGPLLKV